MKVVVDFSEVYDFINKIYRPYLYDHRSVQVFKGGASAGKSYFIAQKIIINIISEIGYNVLCVRKVGATNHDSTFSELKKAILYLGLGKVFKINEARGKEEISCLTNDNKIIFRGLDDPEKIKSVTFETGPLAVIWLEEASEATEDDYNALDFRLRGICKVHKHFILSFNPIDKNHWIKHRFFDRELAYANGFICESTYLDNAFLTDQDREKIESYKDIDYYYYMVYALNEWGDRRQTSVFNNLKIHDFDIPEYMFNHIYHGMDYGYNDPNALVRMGYIDRELYIWKEFYAHRTTNKEFINSVINDGFEKDYSIVADSSHPGYTEEWNNNGFSVYPAVKGKMSVTKGIDYLKALPAIHIHQALCPNTAREFLNFKYREFKDRISDTEYVELDDHTVACTRYANEQFFLDSINKPVFIRT